MPASDSLAQLQLMAVLIGLLVLLVWGRWRYDVVALGALFLAALLGLVPQSELFSGFGNPATITVVLVLIVSFGLVSVWRCWLRNQRHRSAVLAPMAAHCGAVFYCRFPVDVHE
jgi:di/tricarboxylate transporter